MSKAKVMISISEKLLAEIDRVAKEENRSRSEFLCEAAKFYLEAQKSRMTPGQDPRIRRAIAIQDEIACQDKMEGWDSTAEIRKWRERLPR